MSNRLRSWWNGNIGCYCVCKTFISLPNAHITSKICDIVFFYIVQNTSIFPQLCKDSTQNSSLQEKKKSSLLWNKSCYCIPTHSKKSDCCVWNFFKDPLSLFKSDITFVGIIREILARRIILFSFGNRSTQYLVLSELFMK